MLYRYEYWNNMLMKALLLLVRMQMFVGGSFYDVSAIRRLLSEEIRIYVEFSDVILDEMYPSKTYLQYQYISQVIMGRQVRKFSY
jgi:hypothetical protein